MESSEGRLFVSQSSYGGACLPKPVLLRISIARFVSESSHDGVGRTKTDDTGPSITRFVS